MSTPRVVVVTGATGVTGRATAAALTGAGHAVVAVGTDAGRLASVEASTRIVADLADPSAASALRDEVLSGAGRIDGLVHLVGGWRPGWSDDDAEWLNTRLVTTLLTATAALEPALTASPAGRVAILSSTAVSHDGPPTSAYTAAKLAAEAWMRQLTGRWQGTEAAAVTWVVRSLGDGERDTRPDTVARAAVSLWESPASVLAGARIRL